MYYAKRIYKFLGKEMWLEIDNTIFETLWVIDFLLGLKPQARISRTWHGWHQMKTI